MKKPIVSGTTCALFILFLFLFETSFSQTLTAKYNTQISTRTKGFYEYLPDDYSKGNKNYPLIVFFHGVGEIGEGTESELPRVLANGTPKQIRDGIFPKSFTVNGETFKFIVLIPQLRAWPEAEDVGSIIDYAEKTYRIDEDRIYLTGLSMGGKAVWHFPGSSVQNARKVAAIVPVCGAGTPDSERYESMALGELPVWATHNRGDETVSVYKTINFVDGINGYKVPPNPKARMTIFEKSGHDAWSQTYDLNFKENGLNVYEWMLTNKRSLMNFLEVRELKFTAKETGGAVALDWVTKGESNNLGFTVERSFDGIRFDSLAFVPTLGDGDRSYSLSDVTPFNGKNFYRLKAVSTMGKIKYSETISISFRGTNKASIFPNPVANMMNIQTNYNTDKGLLRIFDVRGRTVLERVISGSGNHTIPLNFTSGIYSAILIEDGRVTLKESFVKE